MQNRADFDRSPLGFRNGVVASPLRKAAMMQLRQILLVLALVSGGRSFRAAWIPSSYESSSSDALCAQRREPARLFRSFHSPPGHAAAVHNRVAVPVYARKSRAVAPRHIN